MPESLPPCPSRFRVGVLERGGIRRQLSGPRKAVTVTEADDPDLSVVIIDREQQEVAADEELPHFVPDVGILLGLDCPPRPPFERIHGVPDPLQPAPSVLGRLASTAM